MKKNLMMRVASALLVAVLLTTCAISGTFAKYVTSATSNDHARVAYWGFQSSNTLDITNLFSDSYKGKTDNTKDVVKSADGDDVIAPGTTGTITFSFAWDEDTSKTVYDEGVRNINGDTAGVVFTNKYGPEVAYTFEVEVVGTCSPLIKNNKNIVWFLDGEIAPAYTKDTIMYEKGTFDALVQAIEALSGEADGAKDYAPNTLPAKFGKDDTEHTITWAWLYDADDYVVESDVASETVNAYAGTYAVSDTTTIKNYNQDEYDTFMANAAVLDDVVIKITITATQID